MKYLTNIYPLIFTVCILLVFSCGDSSSSQGDFKDIDVVTGLNFFDESGSPIGSWKEPNENSGEVAVFPIPAAGKVFLSANATEGNGIKQAWLVKADCVDTEDIQIPSLSLSLVYSVDEISTASAQSFGDLGGGNQTVLDLSSNEKGLYRLFYQLANENIHWTNIYIDPSVENFPNFNFLEDLCD